MADWHDLVAGLSEEEGFCAIQCKFYDEHHRIRKSDLDSFFTASGKKGFTRRLIVDSTSGAWSEHAETALVIRLSKPSALAYLN